MINQLNQFRDVYLHDALNSLIALIAVIFSEIPSHLNTLTAETH